MKSDVNASPVRRKWLDALGRIFRKESAWSLELFLYTYAHLLRHKWRRVYDAVAIACVPLTPSYRRAERERRQGNR